MKRNWKRKLVGGLCLTSAAFIFQACYGSPQALGTDLLLEGQVKSKKTGLPLKGIRVSVEESVQYTETDENGVFSFYTGRNDAVKVRFEDANSLQDKRYSIKDTILETTRGDYLITLNIELEEEE